MTGTGPGPQAAEDRGPGEGEGGERYWADVLRPPPGLWDSGTWTAGTGRRTSSPLASRSVLVRRSLPPLGAPPSPEAPPGSLSYRREAGVTHSACWGPQTQHKALHVARHMEGPQGRMRGCQRERRQRPRPRGGETLLPVTPQLTQSVPSNSPPRRNSPAGLWPGPGFQV